MISSWNFTDPILKYFYKTEISSDRPGCRNRKRKLLNELPKENMCCTYRGKKNTWRKLEILQKTMHKWVTCNVGHMLFGSSKHPYGNYFIQFLHGGRDFYYIAIHQREERRRERKILVEERKRGKSEPWKNKIFKLESLRKRKRHILRRPCLMLKQYKRK